MRHQQHRRAVAAPKGQHQRMHPDAGQRVQRGKRLVQQQQARRADQGAGQRRPLRLAAREGQRPGIPMPAQADLLKRRLGTSLGARVGQPKHHVLPHRRPGQQPRLLEHDGRGTRHRDHRTLRHRVQPGQGAQQRRLARPAAAQQRGEAAGLQVEVQPVQHRARAKPPGQAADMHAVHRAAPMLPDPMLPGCQRSARRSTARTRASAPKPSSA